MMDIRIVDPTEIPDWDSRLLQTGKIDFFHTSVWAKVLKESYGYKPLYFTGFENGRLGLSMPLMEVRSVWTGSRGVSLPFTDLCTPYYLDRRLLHEAVDSCVAYGKRAGWKHIDWRSTDYQEEGVPSWSSYYGHEIALSGSEADLFGRLVPSKRRNIRNAIREGVSIESSTAWDAVTSFRRLNCLTRKRHGLPPQPRRFFEKVFEHILSAGHGMVLSAKVGDKVIASSIYVHFGNRALFKYGASDQKYLRLRPNSLIMWEAIRWYHERGFETLSLGRTESDNPGLLRYKRGWGAEESRLSYFRYGIAEGAFLKNRASRAQYPKLLSKLPLKLLQLIGQVVYRQMG